MSIDQAHALGYVHDMDGDPLTDIEQMCELKVQDVIPNRECGKYLVQIAKFIDHLLEKFYELPRFYNVEKPEDLIRWLIQTSSKNGDGRVILDPFMGSGTTACGALREGCNFIGFEMDPEWVDKAQQRIAQAIDEMLEEEEANT